MTEIETMLNACAGPLPDEGVPALATVVKVEGSTYRRAGARMLVFPSGERIGSVSGGCLESDVVERALCALETGNVEYVLYDARGRNGDVVAELGCNGSAGILIEPADRESLRDQLRFLHETQESRTTGVTAIVFRVEGSELIAAGEWMMQRAGGEAVGAIREPILRRRVLADMQVALRAGRSRTHAYVLPNGLAEVMIEAVKPPPALLICGAGEDAAPLARLGAALGWRVRVADPCASQAPEARFAGITRCDAGPDSLPPGAQPDPWTAVVVMSHNYVRDLAWVRALIATPAPYIGVLGPRKRWGRMEEELRETGVSLTAELRGRIHAPAGLDIGSQTAAEIALAIGAEIQAALSRREAGFLRDRRAPIHEDGESPAAALHEPERRAS